MSLRILAQQGWLRSHRFWLARRLVQLTVLGLFALGPWAGIWLIKGNLSGSELLGTVPFSDPLLLLQSIAAGHWPAATALLGGALVVGLYLLLGGRLFCSWVCPVNPLTDAAAWLRRRLSWRPAAHSGNALRYAILALVVALPLASGVLVWELLNPVSALLRGLLFGMGASWLLIATVVALDVAFDRLWCGRLCPLGSFYALLGHWRWWRVEASGRARCDSCMDCYNVCPEPQVLKGPLHGEKRGIGPAVTAAECTSCLRCVEVCSEQVLTIATRRSAGSGRK